MIFYNTNVLKLQKN